MNLNWEITFLLVLIPIYLFGVMGIILSQIPLRYRPLAHLSAGGNTIESQPMRFRFSPNWIIITGFFLHTFTVILRGLRAGHFPATTIYESLIFFSWVLVALSIVLASYRKLSIIYAGSLPVAILLIILALTRVEEVRSLAPALQSYWLSIHAGFAFLSYAAYTVAFVVGVFYILLERQMKKKSLGFVYQVLPSLEVLDEINYFSVAVGFILLTIGIVTGAVWANETWGRYWNWDPKETWSLITWLMYAILLHVRVTSRIRGRKIAYLSILGFGFVIFTYLGVGLMLPGLHSYLAK